MYIRFCFSISKDNIKPFSISFYEEKKNSTLSYCFLFAVSLILFKIKTLSVWVSVWIRFSLLDRLSRSRFVSFFM